MRFIKRSAVLLALVIIAIFIVSSIGAGKDITITINQGQSLMQIAETLKENDVILSKYLFVFKTRLSGNSSNLKYGDFVLNIDMSYDEIIQLKVQKKKQLL